MKRVIFVVGMTFIAAVSFAHNASLKTGRFVIQGTTFEQQAPSTVADAYPSWNPGESVCPLHPTNAVSLAITTATNSLPVTRLSPRTEPELALLSDSAGWYYRVELSLLAGPEDGKGSRVPVYVGLDGRIPPIRKVPAEKLQAERKQIRENLRQYQMEVIRAGMTPLPIPLTQEMDDQLVAEGVLPPKEAGADKTQRRFGNGFRRQTDSGSSPPAEEKKLTPEEQARLREEKRERLRRYQMEIIRAGMPPLPIPQSLDVGGRLEEDGVLLSVPTNSPARRFGGDYPALGSGQEQRPALTPEQQEQKRKEIRLALQRHQMRLIREGKPLLPAGAATLSKEQKGHLEREGIIFLSDGSISNSVTGFCHPPRPGVVEE